MKGPCCFAGLSLHSISWFLSGVNKELNILPSKSYPPSFNFWPLGKELGQSSRTSWSSQDSQPVQQRTVHCQQLVPQFPFLQNSIFLPKEFPEDGFVLLARWSTLVLLTYHFSGSTRSSYEGVATGPGRSSWSLLTNVQSNRVVVGFFRLR